MFFLFKQKTAYELRISDWSSDVCSSDLSRRNARPHATITAVIGLQQCAGLPAACCRGVGKGESPSPFAFQGPWICAASFETSRGQSWATSRPSSRPPRRRRSEEHTSELQSLMRISYAVFCLKKKKHNRQHTRIKYK